METTQQPTIKGITWRGGVRSVKHLPVDEIVRFKSEDKVVIAYHDEGEFMLSEKDSLVGLKAMLGDRFIAAHRAHLVRVDLIASMFRTAQNEYSAPRTMLRMIGSGDLIPVSRLAVPAVREALSRRDAQ